MIIGNGDIASVLPQRKDLLFFASGVSNSQEERGSEYSREHSLLTQQDQSQHIIYFSSLSIFYLNTMYAQHKRHMEKLVKDNFKKYTIIRLGNITWGKNPHTLINFMRNQWRDLKPLTIKDECRYIIDKEEFLHWINLIPDWSCEMNITGKRMRISAIAEEYVYKHVYT